MSDNFKTVGYALPQSQVTTLVRDLRRNGYHVEYDRRQGTMVARVDDRDVVRAFKHHDRWCVRADPKVITPVYAS